MVTQVFIGDSVFKNYFGDEDAKIVVGVDDIVIVVVAFGVVINEGATVVEVTASRIKLLEDNNYFLSHFD